MIDPATLDRMIAFLPPEYGTLLSAELEPPWRQRARRLERRDAIVVVAAGGLGEIAPTRQARALERAYARYLASAWHTDRVIGPLQENVALYRLAVLNDGRGLGWRRIIDILALHPMPPPLQKSPE
ncbi:MAG: hypothetical protein ACRYHQ_03725 [Janthinobacterium lividum]